MRILIKILIGLALVTNYSCQNDFSILSKDISTNLFLANSVDNETGEMIGEGTTFFLMTDGYIEASLDLSKYYEKNTNDLLIHLDWVDETGNSFYKKKQLFTKDNNRMNTSISLSPKLRQSGQYTLNTYVFRELVSSKKFTVLPVYSPTKTATEKVELATRTNKKTFIIKTDAPQISLLKDKWIKASVKINNLPKPNAPSFLYQLNWKDKKGTIFYKKRFSVTSKKKDAKIDCSIEIDPKKKDLGEYSVQLLLFGKQIAEKKFVLIPALNPSKIKTTTTLCKDFKKGKKIGITNDFIILKKNKVKAIFEVNNCKVFGDKEPLNFKVNWVGTDGKIFYSKRLNFIPKENNKILKSSISISPKKRKLGDYKVQLFLFNQLVSESKFALH